MAILRRPVSARRFARSKKARSSKKTITRLPKKAAYTPYRLSSGTNPQGHVAFGGKGFPDMLTTNLVYSDSFILDPSALAICPFKTYRLMSPYDPDVALGGAQATYFDQLAIIYDRYKVNGAKITAIFSRGTSDAPDVGPYIVGINTTDQTTLPTSSGAVLMSTPNTTFEVYTVEKGTSTVVATYSPSKQYPDFTDNLQSRVNNNPTVAWNANVFATPQGVNVDVPINVMVIIEYNVTFSDVKQVIDV